MCSKKVQNRIHYASGEELLLRAVFAGRSFRSLIHQELESRALDGPQKRFTTTPAINPRFAA